MHAKKLMCRPCYQRVGTMSTTTAVDKKITAVDEKKSTPWTLFQKRVRGLTSFPSNEVMRLCSFLKARKDMTAWIDEEIMTLIPEWRASEPDAETKKKTKEAKEVKEVKAPKESKAAKKVKETAKEEDPTPSASVSVSVSVSVSAPAPVEGLASLEFHLNEAKKKCDTAKSIADKEDGLAKKATEKADEAMKTALDFQKKAEKAVATAAEARALFEGCQKEVATRTEEFEKETAATALAAAAAATATATATAVISEPEEPLHLRRKKIPKHIKTLVWNKYIGPETASSDCMSCRTVKISNRSFHCGHVIAESKGGDMNINNLRPICEACNGSMGTRSMNEFTKEFFGWSV